MAGKFFEMFVKIEWEGGSFSGSIYPDARKFCLFEGVATPPPSPFNFFPPQLAKNLIFILPRIRTPP